MNLEDNMIRMLAGVITAAVTLSSLPANADFRVCNHTTQAVTVAVGYINSQGFVSEGWWDVQTCRCELLVPSNKTTDPHNVFFHAFTGDGQKWEGESPFCTSQNEFTHVGKENCRSRGLTSKNFVHVTSPSGNTKQHLRGTPAAHCVDD
jgi:uncharacterized membrane protein